jgi:hypothetical protein
MAIKKQISINSGASDARGTRELFQTRWSGTPSLRRAFLRETGKGDLGEETLCQKDQKQTDPGGNGCAVHGIEGRQVSGCSSEERKARPETGGDAMMSSDFPVSVRGSCQKCFKQRSDLI